MSQQVQELIDKIKSEGIQAAEEKSRDIEGQAQSKAGQVVADAESRANQIIADAQEEARKLKESTEMALKQSARDMLLSLRKQIEATLQKVVQTEVKGSLTSDHLAEILSSLVNSSVKSDEGIEVLLNSKDLSKLKDGFLTKLQKQVKQPIKFESSEDVEKGFLISFDDGKSSFDFTDESLAKYLGNFLNAHVASIVKESV